MNPNRFLDFGGSSASGHASAGGGGAGGSGNFLFDIIRVSKTEITERKLFINQNYQSKS